MYACICRFLLTSYAFYIIIMYLNERNSSHCIISYDHDYHVVSSVFVLTVPIFLFM